MKKRIVAVTIAAFAIVATVLGTSASASETDIVNVDNLQSKELQSTGALKVVDPDKSWDINLQSSDFAKLGTDISTLALALNELGVATVQNADRLKQELVAELNDEKSAREAVNKEIYKILGMANGATEFDEGGNVVERDADGNVIRIVKTETTVNGNTITVTRYDTSKNPAVKIDEVSYDATTGKAVTKEGETIDPIVLPNVPSVGFTTVTINNADGSKSTIVYANGTTDNSIEKYLEEHYNFSSAQLTDVRKLIDDANAAGATTQQEIIQYITKHTITQEVRDTILETLTAPSVDNEFGVSMSEIEYYLKNKVPPASTELINTVIEKYLTLAGLSNDEVTTVVNAMNDPTTDANGDGIITKEELIAYLTSLTDGQSNPMYTSEEIDRLATAYVYTPTTAEVNDYYRAFTPEEVNNISDAMTATSSSGGSSAIQVQSTSDVQLSVLDRIANEEAARKRDIANLNTTVDNKLTTISNEMNTLSGDVDDRLTTLTNTVNTNMSNLSDDVDSRITTLTNTTNTNMSNLNDSVDNKISALTNTVNTNMSSLNDGVDDKITTLTNTVNNRLTAEEQARTSAMTDLENRTSATLSAEQQARSDFENRTSASLSAASEANTSAVTNAVTNLESYVKNGGTYTKVDNMYGVKAVYEYDETTHSATVTFSPMS